MDFFKVTDTADSGQRESEVGEGLHAEGSPFCVCSLNLFSFPAGSDGKASACNVGDPGSIPGLGRSPGKEMATHSSTLAWRIPWTEEPGGL